MAGKLFDSHAHYYDARFREETAGADGLLSEIFSGDVDRIVNVGTNPENNPVCLAMAQKYPGMFAAVGIHPEDSAAYDESAVGNFENFLCEHRDFRSEKIVAIGEIGLDYHYEPFDKEKQKFFFEEQLTLALKYDLPVIVHDRDAHGDCFETILRYPGVRGVFHSYSGSAEMAKELTRRGWYLSFSGVVTFKNANRVREVVASVPHDRILAETDCPYLAPHPMRGKINHSGYLHYTVAAIAEAIGKTPEETAVLTHDNADRLFGLSI